jgi:hypothetical protein
MNTRSLLRERMSFAHSMRSIGDGEPKQRDLRNLPTTERRALDIAVSEASLPRALRIMDALVKALDTRGMPLRITDLDGKQRACVTLLDQKLAVRLVENMSRIEREPTAKEREEIKKYGRTYLPDRFSYQPTGMLKLGIIGNYYDELQKVVGDGKQQRVEQCLNEFVVKLEAEAVHRKRELEHRERQHQLWEEQERRRHEREERQRKEMERLKALEEEVREWKRAERIRAYLAAVEARTAREGTTIDTDSELGQWLAWARHKADWIDPLVDAKCPVLDDADQQEEDEEEDQ